MNNAKWMLGLVCLIGGFVSGQQADAHGPHRFGGAGFGRPTFSYHGYGFGTNHHSFRPSIYNPGWSSYSRASYSSYYGGIGYWPRASYRFSYGYSPVYYSSFYSAWPSVYYSNYYPAAYYYPTYYNTYYTPVVAPVIYSSFSLGFPTCSTTQPASVQPAGVVSPVGSFTSSYAVKKPVTSGIPLRLASQPIQQQVQQAIGGRFVATDAPASVVAPVSVPIATLDSAPVELVAAADAILAAGGYRQAAQAYAALVVKYGNSDRLVTRRFIAQVANGDYEQAAVVVDLAAANGNQIDRADLPQGDLALALGQSGDLIAKRIEGLAANALAQSNDAVPMLTVAHWLALSGDDERANLFKARAAQLQDADAGILVSTR